MTKLPPRLANLRVTCNRCRAVLRLAIVSDGPAGRININPACPDCGNHIKVKA